jgi:hypothetical protein
MGVARIFTNEFEGKSPSATVVPSRLTVSDHSLNGFAANRPNEGGPCRAWIGGPDRWSYGQAPRMPI